MKTTHRPDTKDREIMQKVASANGTPFFTKHAAHEKRAYELAALGLLRKEQRVYATRGDMTEIRWSYSLTDKGKQVLA